MGKKNQYVKKKYCEYSCSTSVIVMSEKHSEGILNIY